MRIGVISDTHGNLRPAAVKALSGCNHIIHAGDLGDIKILMELKRIAPVTIVRGNIDGASWAASIPSTEVVTFGKTTIYVIHNLSDLDVDPVKGGINLVISGHSHKPKLEVKSDVHYLNPGSAGPRRFKLPVTLAILTIDQHEMSVEFVDLLKMEEGLLERLIPFELTELLSDDE